MSRGAKLIFVVLLGVSFAALGCGSEVGAFENSADGGVDAGPDGGSDSGDTGTSVDTDTGSQTDTSGTGSDTDVDTEGCGNGFIEDNEACDDGNSASGDGCSALCDALENGYACPVPGDECVSTVVCGDGRISGLEGCDDSNTESGDGCSELCEIEAGWACLEAGKRCMAAECGDGIMVGTEECDDGEGLSGDGCSDICKLEDGWDCSESGMPCHETVCNDGKKEGSEPCDDGNDVIGDGCTPFCEVEPDCGAGACVSACGDGMMLPGDNEGCDDGNTKSGDGCSSDCQIETGYQCSTVMGELPEILEVPVTYRDFISLPLGSGVRHPDFEYFSGQGTDGLVELELGTDGKPVYTGICEDGNATGPCPFGAQTSSKEAFDQWYRDVEGVNITRVDHLALARQPDDTYYFPDAAFFPFDNDGWVADGSEAAHANGHNYGYTTELRYWFEYRGDERLVFSGDDDVWVFVNRTLVLDLGGMHSPLSDSVVLDDTVAASAGLESGNIYEIVLFQAERHTSGSNFNLTLGGFLSAETECASECGDGIVVGDEVCDDGINDGSYGSCLPDCSGRGPHCGDAEVQPDEEKCDDGVNLTMYSSSGEPGCAPGCVFGSYCGDGLIDSLFGEECDEAEENGGTYGGCTEGCRLEERCGDGIIQESSGEDCDDGNTVSGDGCSSLCMKEGPI